MRKVLIIFLLSVILPKIVFGQFEEKMEEAYMLFKQEKYQEAAPVIDEAITMKKGASSKVAWHIRGFIYKDIYTKVDGAKQESNARETAVESFKKSIGLDDAGTLTLQNKKALKYLSSSYFNDASDIIEMRDIEKIEMANDQYLKYRSLTHFLYPDSAMQDKDVEFYLAMSTAHRRIYESDREKNEPHWQKSNDYLNMVLEIDPQNWPAYYSISVSHYNRGAYKLERLPDAQNFLDIYQIEAESMRSIEVALPYMMKAYELNPEKIEAVKGLKWIYFNLHREVESEKMNEIIEILEGKQNN